MMTTVPSGGERKVDEANRPQHHDACGVAQSSDTTGTTLSLGAGLGLGAGQGEELSVKCREMIPTPTAMHEVRLKPRKHRLLVTSALSVSVERRSQSFAWLGHIWTSMLYAD